MEEFDGKQLIRCACGCGELIRRYYNGWESVKRRFKHGHNWKGKFHYKWKGGIKISRGYIYVRKPDHHFADTDGYVRKHRLIYEKYHKCCLLRWVHIHHINGNRQDNRIKNLQPVSNSQHGQLHKKDMSNRVCSDCGSNKTILKDGNIHWYNGDLGSWLCQKCHDKRRYDKIRKGRHYWKTTKIRLNL